MEIFTTRLKNCRTLRELTQGEVAKNCGIAYPTYRRYESGETEPDISVAAKIARELGVSLDYLAGFTDSPTLSAAPPMPSRDAELLQKIRDLLKE